MSVIKTSGVYISAPSVAPTLAVLSTAGPMSLSAAYTYKYTYLTGYGETEASAASSSQVTSTGSMLVSLTPSGDVNVISMKLYRNTASGLTTWGLVATLAPTATSYSDSTADVSVSGSVFAPTSNTSYSIQETIGGVIDGFAKIRRFNSVVSTGTNLATAAQLPTVGKVYVSTTGANQGVKLPAARTAIIGLEIQVINEDASNSVKVYPFESGGDVTAVGTTAASATLTSGTRTTFQLVSFNSSLGQWKYY